MSNFAFLWLTFGRRNKNSFCWGFHILRRRYLWFFERFVGATFAEFPLLEFVSSESFVKIVFNQKYITILLFLPNEVVGCTSRSFSCAKNLNLKKSISCSIITFNESCHKVITFSLNSRKILLTLSKRIVKMLSVTKIFLISSKFHTNWQQFEFSVECPIFHPKYNSCFPNADAGAWKPIRSVTSKLVDIIALITEILSMLVWAFSIYSLQTLKTSSLYFDDPVFSPTLTFNIDASELTLSGFGITPVKLTYKWKI